MQGGVLPSSLARFHCVGIALSAHTVCTQCNNLAPTIGLCIRDLFKYACTSQGLITTCFMQSTVRTYVFETCKEVLYTLSARQRVCATINSVIVKGDMFDCL